MTKPTTQDLLRKINYIESDLEIHKQILFSIPSSDTAEMEKIVGIIATKKKEIETLRQQIKEQDPEEFSRIQSLDTVVNAFKLLATEKKFTSVTSKTMTEGCSLQLAGGKSIDCLVKACDEAGNWSIITLDGKIEEYDAFLVAEKPPENPLQ